MVDPLASTASEALPTAPSTVRWMRALLATLAPSGSRGRLSILIFHRVLERPDELFPGSMDAVAFADRMRWIRTNFNVLPLEQAIAALGSGRLPTRALAITFDDGYADNATVAVPILRLYDLHATFFVATGYLNGGRMWNDTVIEAVRRAPDCPLDLTELGLGLHALDSLQARRAAVQSILARIKYLPPHERNGLVGAIALQCGRDLPTDLMMNSAQVREIANAGFGIGGHTVFHPILAKVSERVAREEIFRGAADLEAIIGQRVKLFAYPNGKPNVDYAAVHARMAKSLGFSAAVTTAAGAARQGHSLFELPRFTPWDRTERRWALRLAKNMLTPIQTATE